jgi:hypothetical protein
MKQFVWAASILLAVSIIFASEKQSSPFRKAPPEVEEALRVRVERFYSLFKEGKFRQAEDSVTEESKDLFYNSPKKALMGFEVVSLTFNDEFTEANVLVNVDTMFPLMGATPFKVPVAGKWRWVNDDWFLHMESRDNKSPFGEMKGQQGNSGGSATVQGAFAGGARGIKPEAFNNMYALNRKVVKFPAANSDQPVERTVTFANSGPVRLTLELQGPEIPGLEVEVGEGKLEPGDRREIMFRYHPEIARLEGERKVTFGVLPIMRKFAVKAIFPNRPAGQALESQSPKPANPPAEK